MNRSRFIGLALLAILGVGGFTFAARKGHLLGPRAVTEPIGGAAASPDAVPAIRADGVVVAGPGARVLLSAEFGGTLTKVNVLRGQKVKKGEVIAEFDKRQQTAAARQAWAQWKESNVGLKSRLDDQKRAKALVRSGSIATQELDHITSEKTAAGARTAAAGASAEQWGVVLEKLNVVAPIDGTVTARTVEPGETVGVGTPLFEVADLGQLRVQAEVDEFYVGQIAMGMGAEVTAEGLRDQAWSGSVKEIGDLVIPRTLKTLDPSRPSDVGVLQVWISLPNGHPLKLGQRIQVTFHQGGQGGPLLGSSE